MDRDALFTLVLAETTRADLAGILPDLLLLTEAKIARELRCLEMEASATLTFTADEAAAPSDYLGTRSLVVTGTGPLQQVGLAEFNTRTLDTTSYAVSVSKFLARVTSAVLTYFARPTVLASGTDTNAVLDAHPDLYVGLLSFYVYRRTQDLELAQSALNAYNDARDTLNELADRQRGAARIGKGYSFGNGASAF